MQVQKETSEIDLQQLKDKVQEYNTSLQSMTRRADKLAKDLKF